MVKLLLKVLKIFIKYKKVNKILDLYYWNIYAYLLNILKNNIYNNIYKKSNIYKSKYI